MAKFPGLDHARGYNLEKYGIISKVMAFAIILKRIAAILSYKGDDSNLIFILLKNADENIADFRKFAPNS
ncbi:hypothetical protein [Oceanobacillus damuensis]|uniref:hypothetical protein n=1 Tax=Oceanobacillus damuensis TaxID=937928 RepID=UPI0012ED4EFB|nr:hypothetical protein [Oceanobacillus damuensis]